MTTADKAGTAYAMHFRPAAGQPCGPAAGQPGSRAAVRAQAGQSCSRAILQPGSRAAGQPGSRAAKNPAPFRKRVSSKQPAGNRADGAKGAALSSTYAYLRAAAFLCVRISEIFGQKSYT